MLDDARAQGHQVHAGLRTGEREPRRFTQDGHPPGL
jgi:hypothetical protein